MKYPGEGVCVLGGRERKACVVRRAAFRVRGRMLHEDAGHALARAGAQHSYRYTLEGSCPPPPAAAAAAAAEEEAAA